MKRLEPIREPAGTGSFCGALGAKCACPPLPGRFSDRQLVVACLFAICSSALAGDSALTQIKGKVTDVAAGIAKIEISSDATPRVGDQVEFFFTVPELSERAKAGSGVVAEVHGKTVAVKLSGKPTIRKDGEAIVFSKTPVQQERPFTVGGPRSITIGGASPDVPRTIIVGGDSPPAAPKPKTEGSTAFISTVDFDGKVLDGNKPIADLAMQMDENNLKILHVTVDGLTFDQLGLERSQPRHARHRPFSLARVGRFRECH